MAVDPCISFLRELVSIDSVNPSLVPSAAGEGQVAAAIADRMRRCGMDVELQEVEPGRPNVIGMLSGREPGPTLMYCGHMDTVGVDGMAAPFSPEERNGRLYGRGAQDMKAGVAAMTDAARVAAERGFSRGQLIVAAVIDEEYASIGADALVSRWKADRAVVTEPTDMRIGVAHKGFAWLEVETRGRAAHGSRPRDGRDAIMRMGRVLGRLEALDRDLQSRPPHPIMATGSLHASIINGGREWSSYPDRCHLQMERRTIPGEAPRVAAQELDDLLTRLRAEDPDFKAVSKEMFARSPYEIAANHELPQSMLRAAGSSASAIGMSFWTDAAILGDAGIPSILYGPTGAGLHSVEEWVEAKSVTTCRDALVSLARDWCR